MRIEDIGIYTGKPEFEYEAIRRLEVKCEASNALMPAPTIDEANGRLRALAAKLGANVIVGVEYNSGVSFTSWKSLKATGIAARRSSDEAVCEVCAETIKRAALKCRFCGAERTPAESPTLSEPVAVPTLDTTEPLKDTNNPAWIIALVLVALAIFSFAVTAAHSNPAAKADIPVELDGSKYLVRVRGSTVVVASKAFLVIQTVDLRDKMRAAVEKGTGCQIVDEMWLKTKLGGKLSCPQAPATNP